VVNSSPGQGKETLKEIADAIAPPMRRRYAPAIFGSSRAHLYSPPALVAAGLLAAALLLTGCFGSGNDENTTSTAASPAPATGDGGSATQGVYVAEVTGTNDLIALVTDGTRLSGAYLCIPSATSQWIRPAPLQNGQAALVARRGVVLGSAKFSRDTATGTVNAGGERNFTAKLATGDAGLYRKTSGTTNQPGFSESGWVVLPDGNTCGSTNTITSGGGFEAKQETSSPEGQITNFSNPFPF
jgi:hypothetical protein